MDIRATWKEAPGLPRQHYPDRVDTIFYSERGHVLCRNRGDGESEHDNYTAMAYEGWDHKRGHLKYRYPAAANGVACTQADLCNGGCHTNHGRIVRVNIDTNRRISTPPAAGEQNLEARIRQAHRRRTGQQPVRRQLRLRKPLHPGTRPAFAWR